MNKEPRKVREFRRREQEILDTALKLFLEQGEDSVTVEMIADAVGIGKGTIYKHFKSKAEVYLRLMLDYERDLNALLLSEDVAKDKEALARAYFEFRMRDPQRYRLFDRLEEKVVKGNQVPEMVEQLHSIRASNFERLTQLIKARIAVAEQAPPLSVATWLPKKYFSSKIPRGVAMYFCVVTRETVDSCKPRMSAISRRTSGRMATSP